jgi:hypothetical protein
MGLSQYDQLNYAQYVPRTTQEIWAPLQYMRENHDKLEEEYSQQEQQGGLALNGIDPQKDKAAYDIQQNYINETKKAADELATKGFIEGGRRKNLYSLKQQYAQQVVPLQQALVQRNQRAEEYRKLAMDKNNILGVNPNDVKLTDIIKNPKALEYKFLSGAQMAKDVENVAKQYADQLLSPNNVNKIKHLAAYQDLLNIKMGADPSLVLNAMKNNPNTYKDAASKQIYDQLIGTVNSVVDRYGLKDVASTPEEYNRGWQIASSGLSSAIGKSSQQIIHDTWSEGNARLAQQNNNQINYAPTDVDENPEITDSDKYNAKNKDLSVLKELISNGKYTPSSYYKNTKEFKEYEKAVEINQKQRDKNSNQNTMTGYGIGVRPPSNYDDYQKAKKIEDIAKKYGINNFSKLQLKLEGDLDNMRKLTKTMWVDDNKDVAKKHYLQNIISNRAQSQKFEDEVGISPQEVLNNSKKLELLRFGINPRKGLFAQYSESPSKHKKVSLDYGVSGNSFSSTDSRINAAYNKAFEGSLSGNDLVSTGHFKKVNGGYETTTMSDRKNKPIFVSESDVKSGLDNETIGTLFNNILNKVYWNNSSYARSSVDANPTSVGGGK